MAVPLEILKQYWGFDQFRPLQEEIIQSVLEGCDSLALLPTGGGKSLCYQVPALCKEGVCLVISPLIALMKDQVYQLKQRKISADAIYSGLHYKDIDRIFDNAVFGHLKLLYLSPERLLTDIARERIGRMNVNLIAVDEAHCISQWGYDFRPPYLQIAAIRELLPEAPVIALTATATAEVVDDIQEKLNFRDRMVFKKSFLRENLAYVVLNEENKQEKLLDILKKVPGSAVVYARNRRLTKDLAIFLRKNNISADFYHAGLGTALRSDKQDHWSQNRTRVMVATNAFGMGIDKANVRVVVHMDLPDSLEAYFQEAGRAGRDGKKAYAVLLYNETDKYRLQKNYENAFPDLSEIRKVYRALGSYFQLAIGSGMGQSFDFDIGAFCQNFQFEVYQTFSCLKILDQEGWIVLSEAVFVPSTLRVIVPKEILYDYQLRNKQYDKIIKVILRSYQGVFNHYVNINEERLARFLGMAKADFVNALHKINTDNMIDYRPQKDEPQIVFIRERVDADNLTLDQKLYNFRKNRHLDRITQAINFAERQECRSRQLLQYFGEKNAPACGKCDVCLGRNSDEMPAKDFERYKEKIHQLLKKDKLNLEELVDSFSPKRRNQVLKAVEYLLDERIIDYEGEHLIWK